VLALLDWRGVLHPHENIFFFCSLGSFVLCLLKAFLSNIYLWWHLYCLVKRYSPGATMKRYTLLLLSALFSLHASTAHADRKAKAPEANIEQDKGVPRFAVGKFTRSLLLTAGSYVLAGGTTAALLGLNSFCDANGDLVQLGCNSVGFPVLGVFAFAGLTTAALAPSTAHWKIGDKNHAYIATGVRMAGASMVMIGLGEFINNDLDNKARGFLAIGGGALVGLGVYDIFDAGFAPHRLAIQQREALSFRLQPSPLFSKDGNTSLGLSAVGHF
jgi:hypothetical protein